MKALYRTREIGLVLTSICVLLYANTLTGDFIGDDYTAILTDWNTPHLERYLLAPAGLLSSLNFVLAGDNPFVYHLTNITLHATVTLCVFFFLTFFFSRTGAFFGAVLFAVHPIQTETVAWISGRAYAVISFFFFAIYFLYRRATRASLIREHPSTEARGGFPASMRTLNPTFYVLSLALALYFSLAWYHGVLVPGFIILSDVITGTWRKRYRLWIPFLIVCVAGFLWLWRAPITQRVTYMTGTANYEVARNPFVYGVYSFFTHLGLMLWPVRLTLYHEPIVIPETMFRYSALYAAAVASTGVWLLRRAKVLFFALGITLLFLSPTFSPIPMTSLIAERYLYLPVVSLSMVVAYLYDRYAKGETLRRSVITPLLVVLFAACVVRTFMRNEQWKSAPRFWHAVLVLSPHNRIAYDSLGFTYLLQEEYHRALPWLQKADQANPGSITTLKNLAAAYYHVGSYREAAACYQRILVIEPDNQDAQIGLAIVDKKTGRR